MLWSIERHFGGFVGQRPIVVLFVLFFVVAVVFVHAVVDNLDYAYGCYHPLLLHHLQDQLWWLCQLANAVVEAKIYKKYIYWAKSSGCFP